MIIKFLEYFASCFHQIPIGISVWMLVVFCVGTVLPWALLGFKKGVNWTTELLLMEYMFFLLLLAVFA